MINKCIYYLVNYGLIKGLIYIEDCVYVINALSDIMGLAVVADPDANVEDNDITLESALGSLADYACANGLCDDTNEARDRFETRIMNLLTPRPSHVVASFWRDYNIAPKLATDNFYALCNDSNYIRAYRTAKDICWKTATEYGELDITINLAKPEKDPRDIAKAAQSAQSDYPKCLLCVENEGYAGRPGHPARQNLRIIPIDICNQEWGFQYSPYVYYNEHCIVLNKNHIPMIIDEYVFRKLFDFVGMFPHYFVGSNADLPIVGGSILSHEHFQGGNYEFAMAKAPVEQQYALSGFDDIKAGRVKWPMSVVRLSGQDPRTLCAAGAHVLNTWREYTDRNAGIYADTNGQPHNTVTPIARKRGISFELDLVLRNNITTDKHPDGVFHPHAELHHIKKENIGLIEVMGLAVLPSRLKQEMALLKTAIIEQRDFVSVSELVKHAEWADGWRARCDGIPEEQLDDIIQDEIGRVFAKVLEHAGVFKRDEQGLAAFDSFAGSL